MQEVSTEGLLGNAINRTILELKHENKSHELKGTDPINRTILELKRIFTIQDDSDYLSINRTILELKHRSPFC